MATNEPIKKDNAAAPATTPAGTANTTTARQAEIASEGSAVPAEDTTNWFQETERRRREALDAQKFGTPGSGRSDF